MTAAVTVMLAVAVMMLASPAHSCVIQGYDSGDCREPSEFKADMEFCGETVRYRACVPREDPLWPQHDVFNKDKWVEARHKEIVDTRIRHETNETLEDLGIIETGEEGEITVRFFENEDCVNAYKNYFCWLNFPRCNDEDRSLIMCRSACENFFDSCQYSSDLWRCGDPLFFGGAEPEVDDILDDDGIPVYWRAPWPGQPFRDNEFDEEDNEIHVCTPSLTDAAPHAAILGIPALLLALALVLFGHQLF